MTEDEMVGWHHRLDGHECEQAPGDGEGQGSLVCFSPWCRKESDMTLNKLQETVKDREACHVTVHGVTKSWTGLNKEQQQQQLKTPALSFEK